MLQSSHVTATQKESELLWLQYDSCHHEVSVRKTAIKKPKWVYLHHTTSGKSSELFTLQLTFNNSHLLCEVPKSSYVSNGMVYVRSTTNAIRYLNTGYEF